MSLNPGTRLGPYEIEAPLGAGGMGEVYKARDTRLDRTVAIKVLPEHVASNPDLKQRFEREARAVAALNHPHICTLFDIGEQDGVDFLVMEYLEGETLAQRLRKGALPPDQALQIAIQMADALDKAHRQGTVHRDLKPSNIMLTEAGAKLLDFGLAKLRPPGTIGSDGFSTATTQSEPLTGEGAILGTLQYMAPEQLEGHEADARSDIFAFGAVVYEMVTGKKAFVGESQASLIAAILERQPAPIAELQPLSPPALERLVKKCLAKKRDARWQSAGDLAENLRWLVADSSASGSTAASLETTTPRRRPLVWAAVAVAVVGVVILELWSWIRERPAPVSVADVRHTQVTFSGEVFSAALSPDGRTLAYAVGEPPRVMVRDLAGGQALELWQGTWVSSLRWMPDGTRILVSGMTREDPPRRQIVLIPRLGGAAREVAGFSAAYVAVSADGTQLAGAFQANRGVRVGPVSGGESHRIDLDDIEWLTDVEWSPRTDDLAVLGVDHEGVSGVWIVDEARADPMRVFSDEARLNACWSPVADVLYLHRYRSGGTELVRLTLDGAGTGVTEVLLTGLNAGGPCQVSADGRRLLQLRGAVSINLWQVDLGQPGPVPTALTRGTAGYGAPHFSPDGNWVSATTGRGSEVVKIPVAGGDPIPMVTGSNGSWSDDGRRFAFTSEAGGRARVWVGDAEGRQAIEVEGSDLQNRTVTWFPDGRLAWQTPDARDYRIRDLATGSEETLVTDPSVGWVFEPRFSPTGDQVAVNWNRPPQVGLWILSWPGRVERFLAPGLRPVGWSSDGTRIYANQSGGDELVSVEPNSGATETVAQFSAGAIASTCALGPDHRLVVCGLVEGNSDAWLIEDFDPAVP